MELQAFATLRSDCGQRPPSYYLSRRISDFCESPFAEVISEGNDANASIIHNIDKVLQAGVVSALQSEVQAGQSGQLRLGVIIIAIQLH